MKNKRPTLRDLRMAKQDGYDLARFECLERINKLERENKKINDETARAKLQALSNICQAGSTVIESMSKALLSYQNHL
jgi:hypothetical protein